MPKLFTMKTFPPRCPFCGRNVMPPQPVTSDVYYEFDGGTCPCGATFSFDPTARNGGAVLMEALVLACGGDWDRALEMSPDIDFEEGLVRKYSSRTHRVGEPGAFGTLYFIRIKAPPTAT